MPYNFVAFGYRTKKLCSRLSLKNALSHEQRSLCVFSPPLGCLKATYAVYLRLIRKPIVDFLFVIIELFAGCYG